MAAPVRLSNNKKKQLRQLLSEAMTACNQQRFDACERLCKKVDGLYPDHPEVAHLRGIIFGLCGLPEKSLKFLQTAAEGAPNDPAILLNLGAAYMTLEKHEEALVPLSKAWQLDPTLPRLLLLYTDTLVDTGREEEAIELLERELRKHPRSAEIHMAMHQAQMKLGNRDEAIESLNKVLEISPGNSDAHVTLSKILMTEGRMAEAETEIRKALAIRPDDINAYMNLATIHKFDSAQDPDIVAMVHLHEKSVPASNERMHLGFTLGKCFEKLKDYERAFAYLKEANDIRNAKIRIDPAVELAHMQSIIDTYSAETLRCTSGIEDDTPIFVLGMPRCGSTLTEQILAAHPDVDSKGEWSYFEYALHLLHQDDEPPLTLERITRFSTDEWQELGDKFLERIHSENPHAKRVTDKTLPNIRMIGAIHCALPKAKIIHVRRHPLDTCLSIYKENFGGYMMDFAYNLEHLGNYYRMYQKLMQHWRDILPAGVMYELDYEKLVENQEEETRKLLAFCGLPWDDQCLQFNKAKNIVKTASIAQVRKPIYKSSMAAWKRYEKQLQPLIDILGTE